MSKAKNRQIQKPATKRLVLLSSYFSMVAICLIIPLIHIKSTLDPVLYPRFLALGITVFMLAVIMYFETDKIRIGNPIFVNGFFIALILYILISIASLFSAINPIEGLTDVLKWILFFLLTLLTTILMLSSKAHIGLFLKGVVINALLFSIIGFVQYFENAFLNTDPNALYEVKGLMAHKNQFSISLFVLLPFIASGIIILKNIWKKFAILAFIVVMLLILILQTRAVWLAVFISGMITAIIFLMINSKKAFYQLKSKKQKRILFIGGVLFILLLGLLMFYPVGPLKTINNRIHTVFNPAYTSNEWRLEMWDATFQLIKDKPLTGVGVGNWKISVYPYYSEYLPSIYRHWRNPHNDYLLAVSEKGLLGLIAFISMFVVLIYYGIRNMYRSNSIKSLLISTFFVFGVFGYMIISFFSFPNERINHLIFVSMMVAYIISENLKSKEILNKSGIRNAWLFGPILIISSLIIYFGIVSVKSELNIAKAQAAQNKKDWNSMEKYARKGYSYFAPIDPKFSFPVSMYSGITKFQQGKFENALSYFKKSYLQHPTNISVMNNIGSVYGQMGILDSSIVYHQKSLEIFPHYEFGLINLAKAYYLDKDYKNAYQTILSCDPKSTNQEVLQIRMLIEKKLN